MRAIKKVLLDPCFIATLFFVIWMFLFDEQNVFSQCSLYRRLQKLKADHIYYTSHIQKIKKDKDELIHNNELLEQLAREKYYMKRKQEDLYIIVEE